MSTIAPTITSLCRSSPHSPPTEMALVEGFLLKKSYISYRVRYFQLDGPNLLYKASKEDMKERNLMTLTGESQVTEFKAKRGE